MDAPLSLLLPLAGAVLATALAGRAYFHRVRVERPPVGVFNLRDVWFTYVVLVVIPPLYLHLPRWLVGAILVLTATGLSYLTLTSALGRRAAVVLAAALVAGEVALPLSGHAGSGWFVALNDAAVALLVVGVCNIWAQSGIRARDVAVFAAAVAVYDLVATGLLPLMLEFFTRVQALPFAPTMAAGHGGRTVGIGMGDLLFVLLWPLVAEKAYSRRAGLAALAATRTPPPSCCSPPPRRCSPPPRPHLPCRTGRRPAERAAVGRLPLSPGAGKTTLCAAIDRRAQRVRFGAGRPPRPLAAGRPPDQRAPAGRASCGAAPLKARASGFTRHMCIRPSIVSRNMAPLAMNAQMAAILAICPSFQNA